jgi:predicted RNA-binding protein with PIN domain
MAYIVDGNNVIGQTPGWHRDKPGARRRLLDSLAVFAQTKKSRITVAFDGAPEDWLPDGATYRGVKVFYARRGSNADHRIEQLVEISRDRRGITVVTSDRRLTVEVRALGASTMRSGEFRKLVEETIQSAPGLEDGEDSTVEDVNSWMRYFGVLPTDDEAR